MAGVSVGRTCGEQGPVEYPFSLGQALRYYSDLARQFGKIGLLVGAVQDRKEPASITFRSIAYSDNPRRSAMPDSDRACEGLRRMVRLK